MAYSAANKTVLIEKQTTLGTATTPAKDLGIVSEITDSAERELFEVMSVGAIDVQQIITGQFTTAGSISLQLQHGRPFEFILGTVSHVETSSDWVHTFTIAENQPFFTIESSERGSTDTVRTVEGCFVSNAELNYALNQPLSLKMDFVGRTVASSASATTKVIDTIPVFPHSLITIEVGGTAATQCQTASIKFIKTVTPTFGPTDNLAQSINATSFKVEFTATLGFDAKTWQEKGIGSTAPPSTADPSADTFEMTADNGVALGSGQRKIYCKLANVQYHQPYEVAAATEEIVFLTFSGKGTVDTMTVTDDISDTDW